jgi:methyl-accepting chemotaxis protein
MANASRRVIDKRLVDSMVDEIVSQMRGEQKDHRYVQVSLPQADVARLRQQLESLQKTLMGDEIEIAQQFSEKIEDMHQHFESRIDAVEAGVKELKRYFETEVVESSRQMTERFENISDRIETKADRLAQQMQEIRGEVEGLVESVDSVRPPAAQKKEDDK